MLESNYEISFNALVKKLPITVSVVPGHTPFLLARPMLEQWGVKQDYASGNMKVAQSEWFQPSRGQKGHYVLNLLEYHEDEQEMNYIMEEEVLITTSPLEIEPPSETDPSDIAEQILMESEENEIEKISQQVLQRLQQERKLIFYEVYVDEGNLATELLKRFPDCEVATFSLPHWDFEKKMTERHFSNW